MATVTRSENFTRNQNYASARLQKPVDKIASVEENSVVKVHSFPASADSFQADLAASHTMQIVSYRSENFELTKRLYNQAKGTLASTGVNVGFFEGAAQGATNALAERIGLGTLFDADGQASDETIAASLNRDYLNERWDRLLGQTRQMEGIFSFYIPSPIIFTNTNDYEDISLTERFGNMVTNALGIPSFINESARGIGQMAGLPVNPKIEILFKNSPQRSFQFEFLFAPSSEAESQVLRSAIHDLRRFMAPERQIGTGFNGLLWKAPNTFDIIFMHNGKENTQIPRIQECVMEKIDVDYTPTGQWSTFWNGHPVQMRVNMQFREREPNDRNSIEGGFF